MDPEEAVNPEEPVDPEVESVVGNAVAEESEDEEAVEDVEDQPKRPVAVQVASPKKHDKQLTLTGMQSLTANATAGKQEAGGPLFVLKILTYVL